MKSEQALRKNTI